MSILSSVSYAPTKDLVRLSQKMQRCGTLCLEAGQTSCVPEEIPVRKVSGVKRKGAVVDRESEETVRMSPAPKKVWQRRAIGKGDREQSYLMGDTCL